MEVWPKPTHSELECWPLKSSYLNFEINFETIFFLLKFTFQIYDTIHKLGNKERFDKEQIVIKEPFPVTNLPFTS